MATKTKPEIIEQPAKMPNPETAPSQIVAAPRPMPRLQEVERPTPPGRTPMPSLARALAAAQDRCKAANKNATNTFQNFDYASADEVIATASDALRGSGLAIVPAREELVAIGSTYALNRLILLVHESGEVAPLEVRGWPVVPDRGKPLDKAFAIALTSSLAYKLRDLLRMPRGGGHADDDVSAQDDRQTPDVPPPRTNGKPVGNRAMDWVLAMEARLAKAGVCEPEELVVALEEALGSGWMVQDAADIKAFCREREATWRKSMEAATAE